MFDGVEPVTPPTVVILAMLGAYLYAWSLGIMCLVSPWASEAEAEGPAAAAQFSVFWLTFVYAVDALLAASPMHWCCMRSIPPKNVVQHHVPFVLGMAPSALLYFFRYDLFRSQLLPNPVCMMYMAAGCLTSSNEALWVVSSFFTPAMLESKAYRVGQKIAALWALSQFLVLGGIGAGGSCYSLIHAVAAEYDDPAAVASGINNVRLAMIAPCVTFFLIVPFVQIPLLKGAWGRFLDALDDKKYAAAKAKRAA